MIRVNGITAASLRFLASWSGVWTAEVDMAAGSALPTGRVAIATSSGDTLVGTADRERSGTFGERVHLRVVGGADGWRKTVRAQHYNSSIGLQLRELVSTTAAEVGEIAVVMTPTVVGLDFVRRNAEASQIFADLGQDWWVDADGVTNIGVRPTIPAPKSFRVLDWDPAASTMSFTCDVLVHPGTLVVDERFGRRVVREVEAAIAGASVTGTLWVGAEAPAVGSVDTIAQTIGTIARAETRIEHARFHEYRVIAMAGDRVELQAVTKAEGFPDVLPSSVWAGVSGYRAKLKPSSRVLVGHRGGDPRYPFVAFYAPPESGEWRPLELDLDAEEKLTIGEQSASVILGEPGTALAIARAAAIEAFADALASAVDAMATAEAAKPAVPPATHPDLAITFKALGEAIRAAGATMKETLASSKVSAS